MFIILVHTFYNKTFKTIKINAILQIYIFINCIITEKIIKIIKKKSVNKKIIRIHIIILIFINTTIYVIYIIILVFIHHEYV